MPYCTKCGEKVADDVIFCVKCGQKVGAANANQPENPAVQSTTAGNNKKIVKFLIAMVIIFVLFLILLPGYLFEKRRSEFLLHRGHAMLVKSLCTTVYTAREAYRADHPDAQNITLEQLRRIDGYLGDVDFKDVVVTFDSMDGTITCSGPDSWGVSPARVDSDGRVNQDEPGL